MSSLKLTELPISTASTNGDVLYIVNNYVDGDPVLTGDSKQISVSAFSESVTIVPFPYTGNPTITGSLTVTGGINNISISKGGGNAEQNTAIGIGVLTNNTWSGGDSGNYNTVVGNGVLSENQTGFGNTTTGVGILVFSQTTSENSAFGFQNLFFDVLGNGNTAIGSRALNYLGNSQITAQNYNTALGADAGRWTTSGGTGAMGSSTNSIFLGYRAFSTGQTRTNQIVIGTYGRGNGSNTTTIGNSSMASLFLGGNPGEGIVMRSPDGTRYRVTITDIGGVSVTAI